MTGISRTNALPAAALHRAPAAPAARLSTAEQAQIADAFPAKPQVAQRLYGADRAVQTATSLGANLDVRG